MMMLQKETVMMLQKKTETNIIRIGRKFLIDHTDYSKFFNN